jgi:hypothetical protein
MNMLFYIGEKKEPETADAHKKVLRKTDAGVCLKD